MIYFNETEEIYRLWELSCRCCLYHDSYQRVPRQELLQRWGDFCPSSLSEEERFSFCLLCWAVEVAVRYKELMEESYPADFSKRMTGQSHLAEALASSLLGNAMFEPKEGLRSPLPLLKEEEAPGKGEAFPYLKEELFYRLKWEEDKLTIVPLEESERERIRYAYQRLLDAQAVKPFLELGYRLYSTLKKGKGKLEVQKGNQEVQKGNQEEQKGSQEEQKVDWKALLSSLPLAELEAIYGETQNLAEPDWKKRRKKNLEEQKLDIYDNIISYLEKVTKVTDRERRAKDRDRAEEKAERNAELLNGRKAKHNERNNERIKEEVKAEIKDEEKESCQDLTSIRIPISFLESSAETILLTLLVYRQALAQNGSAEDYLPFPGVYSYTLGLYGNIRVAPDNAFKMVKAEAERGEGELLKDILRIADHYMLRISPEAFEELEKAQKAPEEEVLHCTPLYSKAGDGFSSLRSKAGDDSSPLHSKAGDDSSFLITSQEELLKELFSLSSDRAPQRWSLWVGSEEAREVSREQEEVVLEGLRRSSYISLRDKGGREIYEALSFLKACKRAPKKQQGGLDYYNAFYPLVFCRKGKSPTILSEREENAREMYQRAASLLPAFLQEHRSDKWSKDAITLLNGEKNWEINAYKLWMGYLCWVNITSLSWEVEGNIPFLKEDLLAKATRLLPSKYPDYVKAVQEKSFLLHLRWEENTRECSLEKVNRIEEEELRSWLLMDGPIPEWTQERETYFRDFACRAMANLWEEKRNLVAGKSGEGNGFSRKSLKKVTEPDLFLKILFSYDSYRLRKMNPKCTGACLWWKDGEEGKNLWIQPYSGTTGKQQLFLEGYGFEELLDWIIQDSQDFDSYLCALDPRGACDQTEPIHCRFTLIFCEKDTTLKAAKKPLSLYPELKETCFYLYSGSYHPISKMD